MIETSAHHAPGLPDNVNMGALCYYREANTGIRAQANIIVNFTEHISETAAASKTLAKCSILGAAAGVASGIASAVFLRLLDGATSLRESRPWMLFLLPLAGLLIGWIYDRYGQSVVAGTNLILESIHSKGIIAIPFRMVPLVLGGTILTHLFGGSAGREGTAVQMGGTLANVLTKPLRLSLKDHRLLLMSGISGGFGSVFGTPLAGMVFGLEILSVGRVNYTALIPCFVASCTGDIVCRTLGIQHATYSVGASLPEWTPYRCFLILVVSVLFAGAAAGFVSLTEGISHQMKARVKSPFLRPFLGGLILIGLTCLVGTHDYLGLSLPLIAKSFTAGHVAIWVFALKMLFTSVTLGTGFKGGEVTPLFCIGATLGAAFAHLTGQPPTIFAALGFVGVFAGAANTPLTCILMGIELFGAKMAIPLAATCLITYVLSGHRGIYPSQLIAVSKADSALADEEVQLRDVRDGKTRVE
ncbi:MAG: chloride channel protein [Akkermansiaceae bacterium]|nr:chloride channel protein [Armatimonadota bacterium]